MYHGYKYSMWPHHSTRQFLTKEAETASEMLDRLIAQDFTKFVSRWQFKAYIRVYLLPFGNKHWTSVFFLIQAICIKLQ